MPTKIIICTCEHKDQDAIYGKKKRLANTTAKGEHRCTVCSKTVK